MGTLPLIAWATYVGRQTIQKFRQQHQSEKTVAAAERVLTAAYAARDAFSAVRSPMIEAAELDRAERKVRSEYDFPEEFDQIDINNSVEKLRRTQVYYTRINSVKAEIDSILAVSPIARAYFGKKVYDALERILHQRRVVLISADALGHDDGMDKSHTRTIHADLSSAVGDDDLGKVIDNQVEFIETVLLPILRTPEGKSYSLKLSLREGAEE